MREPYIQTFQYKILNRTLNCNNNLYKWEIKKYLQIVTTVYDTLEHHLFYCDESKLFWENIERWISEIFKVKFKFTSVE